MDEVDPDAPPPPAPRATTATIYVSGTYKIQLVRGGETWDAPCEVPPGDYKVMASPVGADPFTAGKLTAVAGVSMQVLCSEALRGCRIRER